MSVSFTAPADAEFLREFGSEVVAADGEPWIRSVTVPLVGDAELELSFDEMAASVEFTWSVGGRPVVTVTREGAVRLLVVAEKGTTGFLIEFDHGKMRGTLRVQAFPAFSMTDVLLVSGR